MAEPLVRRISPPNKSKLKMIGRSQNFFRIFINPQRSLKASIVMISFRMDLNLVGVLQVFCLDRFIPHPEDRIVSIFPFLELHRVGTDQPS